MQNRVSLCPTHRHAVLVLNLKPRGAVEAPVETHHRPIVLVQETLITQKKSELSHKSSASRQPAQAEIGAEAKD